MHITMRNAVVQNCLSFVSLAAILTISIHFSPKSISNGNPFPTLPEPHPGGFGSLNFVHANSGVHSSNRLYCFLSDSFLFTK
jgi:hypothetical protein